MTNEQTGLTLIELIETIAVVIATLCLGWLYLFPEEGARKEHSKQWKLEVFLKKLTGRRIQERGVVMRSSEQLIKD